MSKAAANSRLGGEIRRILADKRGLAATEFALIAPFMIALWLGAAELTQAITIDRKVSHASSALADLVTQQTNLTNEQVEDIMDATVAILSPYDTNNLTIEMAGVWIDEDGATEVEWGVSRRGSAPSRGSSYAIPDSLIIPETFLVVAQLSYAHTPVTTSVITGPIQLQDEFFLRPRRSADITCCN
ncbi:MAG: TadE/TadG family type IV pilus assembly protein [Pseudomonadota bacterium]